MHRTLDSSILGYVDKVEKNGQSLMGVGWAFHKSALCSPIRAWVIKIDGSTEYHDLPVNERPDVDSFYGGKSDRLKCGWSFNVTEAKTVELEMKIEGEWTSFYRYNDPAYKNLSDETEVFRTRPSPLPTYIVVDNFYDDPDLVREFALKQNFKPHKKQHKGCRTEIAYRPESIKTRFEQIMGSKIKNWDYYLANGTFQYCVDGDPIVYHQDLQQYAGVVYLTPDAPPNSGTSFFRSKHNKLMKITDPEAVAKSGKSYNQLFEETYPNYDFLDASQFELVDKAGNRYNRMVIWDAQLIHAASSYFGDNRENSRLFHLFFFDLE